MPQNGYEQESKTLSRLSYTPVKVCVSHHILYFRCGHLFYFAGENCCNKWIYGRRVQNIHRTFCPMIHGGIW